MDNLLNLLYTGTCYDSPHLKILIKILLIEAEVSKYFEVKNLDDIKEEIEKDNYDDEYEIKMNDTDNELERPGNVDNICESSDEEVIEGISSIEPDITRNPNCIDQLSNHIAKKNNEGKKKHFICGECGRSLSSKAKLVSHKISKHNIGEKLTCSECDFQAAYKEALQRHTETVHKNVRYQCDHCDFKATQKGSLKIHIKTQHEGVKITRGDKAAFVCSECGKSLSTKEKLRLHKISKHDIGEKHLCSECEFQTAYKEALQKHVDTVHRNVRYPCDQCDYKATQKGSLRIHIRAQHEGVKFTCDKCGKIYGQYSTLARHIEYMHGTRRYKCGHCDYVAGQPHHLSAHKAAKHKFEWETGDQPS